MADKPKLQTADDVAIAALSQTSQQADDELKASNELAETLTSLQNLIERYANQVIKIKAELKEKRESLRGVFENDQQLASAEEKANAVVAEVKERKSKLQSSPEAVGLRNQIGELNEQKKEVEEALSDHLVHYYQMTNSTSFDTSDGDQWEFVVSARVKSKKN